MSARAVALAALLFAAGCQSTAPSARLEVRGKAQAHSLSCESRSACDLLDYYGQRVSEDAFFAGLARSDNPDLGFVGDVDAPAGRLPPEGYGVHGEPVAQRLRAYGLAARSERGRDLDWLRQQLRAGRPVIVWATAKLDAPAPTVLVDARGDRFRAARGEHTFLAVGYDGAMLRLLDPATGTEKSVPARRFDASWAVLGRLAVVID